MLFIFTVLPHRSWELGSTQKEGQIPDSQWHLAQLWVTHPAPVWLTHHVEWRRRINPIPATRTQPQLHPIKGHMWSIPCLRFSPYKVELWLCSGPCHAWVVAVIRWSSGCILAHLWPIRCLRCDNYKVALWLCFRSRNQVDSSPSLHAACGPIQKPEAWPTTGSDVYRNHILNLNKYPELRVEDKCLSLLVKMYKVKILCQAMVTSL